MSSDTSARLMKLYRADFADRTEVLVRLGSTGFVSMVLVYATDNWLFMAWAMAYYGQQYLYFRTVDPRRRGGAQIRLTQAKIIYFFGAGIFVSAPLYFLHHPDPVLFAAALLALLANALYILHRENPSRDTIPIETLFFALSGAVLATILWPHLSSLAHQVVVLSMCAICIYLFWRAQHVDERRQLARRTAERRYAQAQKARALNQFVGGVAHDFNNQLTAIMGNLELIDLLDDAEERRSAMQQCRVAAERAAQTVHQLVASSGRTRLNDGVIDVAQLLGDIAPVLEDLLDPKVKLTLAPIKGRVLLVADRDMLETCLIQICLNAQDAMKAHGQITIGASSYPKRGTNRNPGAKDGHRLVGIYVQDAGPGVESDTLNKLSEPFFTTKGVRAGTGLGLSAVEGFAKQSGGALEIDNAAAGGLLVTILLPQAKPEELRG